MTNLVLLSITITTNVIPAHYSGPETKPFDNVALGLAIYHPARTNVNTNYTFGIIEGTNKVASVTFTK